MKKYMLLLIGSPNSKLDLLPPNEIAAIHKSFGAWVQNLVQKNRFVDGNPLSENRKLLTGGKIVVQDGPFAESKETMNGYFIINAENLDEAVELSKNHPCFMYGGQLEVVEIGMLK